MNINRFSARAEQEIKEFCEMAVNIDKFFKNEQDAMQWYLANYNGQFCSLYDCPVKTALEYKGEVNTESIKEALRIIPYISENNESANLLGCTEEYCYLSSHCDCLKEKNLSYIQYAAICQTLNFKKDVLKDYIQFQVFEDNVSSTQLNEIWNKGNELLINGIAPCCLKCIRANKKQ